MGKERILGRFAGNKVARIALIVLAAAMLLRVLLFLLMRD